jgi:hypothetical protein
MPLVGRLGRAMGQNAAGRPRRVPAQPRTFELVPALPAPGAQAGPRSAVALGGLQSRYRNVGSAAPLVHMRALVQAAPHNKGSATVSLPWACPSPSRPSVCKRRERAPAMRLGVPLFYAAWPCMSPTSAFLTHRPCATFGLRPTRGGARRSDSRSRIGC